MPEVNPHSIESSIQLLNQYFADNDEIKPLMLALEALKEQPEDDACFKRLSSVFNDLGITQDAVLTHAPYLIVILSDDPYVSPKFGE